jgi:hypothetical protein
MNKHRSAVKATCQWNNCGKPATHQDKYGMLFCKECAREAAPYTCNMTRFSAIASRQSHDAK